MATWRSGYAAACKAVYTGSIPVVASMQTACKSTALRPCHLLVEARKHPRLPLSCPQAERERLEKWGETVRSAPFPVWFRRLRRRGATRSRSPDRPTGRRHRVLPTASTSLRLRRRVEDSCFEESSDVPD